MQTTTIKIVGKVHKTLVTSDKRHRIIVGGRGKGASWSIARILLLKGMSAPRFIVCVREVQKTIEHSVKKLLADQIESLGLDFFYKVLNYEIRGINGTKFIFTGLREYNADNIKSLEGADDCWIAEAQTISRRSINILRPTIRKDGSVVWWDFNPRYDTDPVYVDYILNKDPNAVVCELSWKDNPWFTESLKLERESDYRRNEEQARHIWEGELHSAGDKFVVPSELFDIAINNRLEHRELGADFAVGADIAHQGGDEIVFYKRQSLKVIDKYYSKLQDTITTTKDLAAFTNDKTIPINIDNGSIGAAVADILERNGYMVNRINFGGKPLDPAHYEDVVTEMYFEFKDVCAHADIPNDEMLRNQTIQRKYDYINGRRGYEVMKIESKDKFREHVMGFNSPDRADALMLCFYQAGSAPIVGTLNVY
jgi:PBSX family phage terminase large subunit